LGGTPYTGYPAFSAPDSYATYLKDCGFDVFLTANNHIFDKGKAGAERTIRIYGDLGIAYTGIAADNQELADNMPLVIKDKGISLALVNMTYGTNTGIGSHWPHVNRLSDRKALAVAMKTADSYDFTIALPHWGNEYELTHSVSQEEAAEWLIDNGADIIVGAHPHVTQDMQKFGETYVIYSLGNAVSNMSAANTQIELMVKIRIAREGARIKKLLPPEFTYLWCSRPGGYCSSYTVIPVTRFIGTRNAWQGSWEYDKMMTTYGRVKEITGIEE
jgi:poly-gamma-glutamate synthesis protein (capsule biosynthesis protein)